CEPTPRQPRGDNPPHRTPLQPVRAAAQHSPYRAPDLRPPAPSCPTLGPASADQFFAPVPEAHGSSSQGFVIGQSVHRAEPTAFPSPAAPRDLHGPHAEVRPGPV